MMYAAIKKDFWNNLVFARPHHSLLNVPTTLVSVTDCNAINVCGNSLHIQNQKSFSQAIDLHGVYIGD